MGKEWLQWVGGSGGGGRRRRLMPGGMEEPASAGCMCAVFRLFDLHHFHFPPNQQNTPTDFQLQPNTSSKGIRRLIYKHDIFFFLFNFFFF